MGYIGAVIPPVKVNPAEVGTPDISCHGFIRNSGRELTQ